MQATPEKIPLESEPANACAGASWAVLDPAVFTSFRSFLDEAAAAQVYRIFLADTRQRIGVIAADPACSEAAGLAHTVKGTAGMLGASAIAYRAAQVEHCLPHPPSIASLLARLYDDCAALEAELKHKGVAV